MTAMIDILQPHIDATLEWMERTGTKPPAIKTIEWSPASVAIFYYVLNAKGEKFMRGREPALRYVELPVEVIPYEE